MASTPYRIRRKARRRCCKCVSTGRLQSGRRTPVLVGRVALGEALGRLRGGTTIRKGAANQVEKTCDLVRLANEHPTVLFADRVLGRFSAIRAREDYLQV